MLVVAFDLILYFNHGKWYHLSMSKVSYSKLSSNKEKKRVNLNLGKSH